MAEENRVLVLGAAGGIGGEMTRQLRNAGWNVRALTRRSLQSDAEEGLEWVSGDAMSPDDVLRAARGCSVIVHAVNPPGYRHWAQRVLPMIDNTLRAAVAEHATIVLPGTVYNYGPDAFPVLDETSPQRPVTRKGAIRVELEARLRSAASGGAVRAIIVRAGDFFGPRAGNSWFSQGLVRPGRRVSRVQVPNEPGVGHQWAYLPDVAQTMVELLARRNQLRAFETFHMAGHWDCDGTQMSEAIGRIVASRTGLEPVTRQFPWWLMRLAAPFETTVRELLEMRYLWREPVRMSNRRLLAVLGYEPHTPLLEAVEATLEGLGCLPEQASVKSARSDRRMR